METERDSRREPSTVVVALCIRSGAGFAAAAGFVPFRRRVRLVLLPPPRVLRENARFRLEPPAAACSIEIIERRAARCSVESLHLR